MTKHRERKNELEHQWLRTAAVPNFFVLLLFYYCDSTSSCGAQNPRSLVSSNHGGSLRVLCYLLFVLLFSASCALLDSDSQRTVHSRIWRPAVVASGFCTIHFCKSIRNRKSCLPDYQSFTQSRDYQQFATAGSRSQSTWNCRKLALLVGKKNWVNVRTLLGWMSGRSSISKSKSCWKHLCLCDLETTTKRVSTSTQVSHSRIVVTQGANGGQ